MELREAFEYGLISRYRLRTGLKPCRICGGQAELFEQWDSTFVISCCECGVTTHDTRQEPLSIEGLFRLWNCHGLKDRVMGDYGLLSCPWCGDTAERVLDKYGAQYARCMGCGMRTLSVGEADKTWNLGWRFS